MIESVRKWSWIIAGILAVIASLYFGLLIVLFIDFSRWVTVEPIDIFIVLLLLSSAAAPFLAMAGLAKRLRPVYLVSAIWFLVLTIFFGTFAYLLASNGAGPSSQGLYLFPFAFIPCLLCAALSYLQGRLYIEARRETA